MGSGAATGFRRSDSPSDVNETYAADAALGSSDPASGHEGEHILHCRGLGTGQEPEAPDGHLPTVAPADLGGVVQQALEAVGDVPPLGAGHHQGLPPGNRRGALGAGQHRPPCAAAAREAPDLAGRTRA
eukprot:2154485-Pyramimonas_sp.AAC.1